MQGGVEMALADYKEHKPVIETGRLILRPMYAGDIPSLKEWMTDPSIYAYWGRRPGTTDRNSAQLFEKKPKPSLSFHLGIAEKSSGKVIGELWIYKIENCRMAAAAIRLSRTCQNKGYGREALWAMTDFCFRHTELQRIYAEADVRNIASWKMLEACGYRREGMIRQGKLVSTWCDYYIYGILSKDWKQGIAGS